MASSLETRMLEASDLLSCVHSALDGFICLVGISRDESYLEVPREGVVFLLEPQREKLVKALALLNLRNAPG